MSTERRFLTSTLAAYGSQLGRMVINFGLRLVLHRLVLPEGHGLFELAFRIILVAAALRDLGLPYQLIRDPRRPYGTVLRFTLISGLLIAALLALGAPVFAGVSPELPELIRVLSLWVVLDALVVVPRAYFDRELRIDRMMWPEILRALGAAAIAIPLAAGGFGVWALVWGELCAAALFAALLWRSSRGQMPTTAEPGLLPGLLRRSLPLFCIWILILLATYVDIYIIEWFADVRAVGYYNRAYFVAFLVPTILAPRAITAALVAWRHDHERFVTALRIALCVLLSFEVVAGYFLYFNADKVVDIILGKNFGPSAALLRILCFVPFLDPFGKIGGEALKALDRDRLWLLSMALNLVTLVGFGILLTSRHGSLGMAAANFLQAGNLIMAFAVARIAGPRFRQLLGDLLGVYLLPLPLFLLAAYLAPPDSWSRFAVSAAAAGISGALLAWRFRGPYRDLMHGRPAPAAA